MSHNQFPHSRQINQGLLSHLTIILPEYKLNQRPLHGGMSDRLAPEKQWDEEK